MTIRISRWAKFGEDGEEVPDTFDHFRCDDCALYLGCTDASAAGAERRVRRVRTWDERGEGERGGVDERARRCVWTSARVSAPFSTRLVR